MSQEPATTPVSSSNTPARAATGAELVQPWGHDKQRFSVAMWDFSWLVRRTGTEDEYRHFDRILDESVDRGYNCLRIDPSPHLLAAVDKGSPDEFLICPHQKNFVWGNHTPVQVSPRASLKEFLGEIKQRPISLALASWFLDDNTHCKQSISSPQDYADIWLRTLEVIADEGLMDRVLWVDLCNEFPMSIWAPRAYQQIFRTSRTHGLMPSVLILRHRWRAHAIDAISRYFDQSISTLRRHYPNLRFTFSCQQSGAENLRRIDLSSFDLLEPHIWFSDDLWWSFVSKHYKAALGFFSHGVREHATKAGKIHSRFQERFVTYLSERMSFWKSLAGDYGIPLVTTEGWVSTFYNDTQLPNGQDEWAWFKNFTETAVQLAIEHGWSGICTSNFCQPHFRNFWADREWHRKITHQIASADVPSQRSRSC